MSQPRPGAAAATAGPPRIPPPPKMDPRRGRTSDARLLSWAGALAAGVGAGVAGYHFLPGVARYFDYWLALALG